MSCIVHAGLVIGLSFPFDGVCESEGSGLTLAGLAIMCVSIGGILTLVVWCYRKVLRLPRLDEEGPK